MNNKMDQEQYLNFLAGQVTVLKYACATLIGMLPDRNSLIGIIKNIPTYPIPPEDISSADYKRGMQSIVEELDALSNLTVLAEAFRAQGVGKTKQ